MLKDDSRERPAIFCIWDESKENDYSTPNRVQAGATCFYAVFCLFLVADRRLTR
jgi:hypothetical protein